MSVKDLIRKNRSFRRFNEEEPVDKNVLSELIDNARLSASGANLQPLKYAVSASKEKNEKIFPHLAWAGYLKDWDGPDSGERPAAYIIILGDTSIRNSFGCDHGIAAQSILLGAVEKGYGGCMIASVNRKDLRRALDISDRYEILLVIALGKPAEKVVIDPVDSSGGIEYWRDNSGIHHVPKRSLADLILPV